METNTSWMLLTEHHHFLNQCYLTALLKLKWPEFIDFEKSTKMNFTLRRKRRRLSMRWVRMYALSVCKNCMCKNSYSISRSIWLDGTEGKAELAIAPLKGGWPKNQSINRVYFANLPTPITWKAFQPREQPYWPKLCILPLLSWWICTGADTKTRCPGLQIAIIVTVDVQKPTASRAIWLCLPPNFVEVANNHQAREISLKYLHQECSNECVCNQQPLDHKLSALTTCVTFSLMFAFCFAANEVVRTKLVPCQYSVSDEWELIARFR